MSVNPVSVPVSERSYSAVRNVSLVIGASFVIALCARFSVPLPYTPVPLSLANFGVLAVSLTLGSRRGFAAAALYLAQGAAGMPVFSPAGPGGLAQLIGPTGGFLLAYPLVAFLCGWLVEHGARGFFGRTLAAVAGEALLFLSGVSWLMVVLHIPASRAAAFGLYPFLVGEVGKIMLAAGAAGRLRRYC